jgi:hypothetical protein
MALKSGFAISKQWSIHLDRFAPSSKAGIPIGVLNIAMIFLAKQSRNQAGLGVNFDVNNFSKQNIFISFFKAGAGYKADKAVVIIVSVCLCKQTVVNCFSLILRLLNHINYINHIVHLTYITHIDYIFYMFRCLYNLYN